MRKLALLTILSAALLLQGCGFHLRGKVELAPELASVYVDGPDPDLVADLEDALDFSGAEIVSSADVSTSVVLIDSRYERDVRTLDNRGIATGYILRYNARFGVLSPEGEKRFQSDIIRLRRNFDYDATQALQKEVEEEFLKEDMREQIIQRVMRQLSTL
ncbi:MAG: LPS-assembly lipoprotein LptE [marine bacterium B5-7]|nr:MAG: LPS-assembly lipoprotein LptE [marine bacterium B5-7]